MLQHPQHQPLPWILACFIMPDMVQTVKKLNTLTVFYMYANDMVTGTESREVQKAFGVVTRVINDHQFKMNLGGGALQMLFRSNTN
jgi:hypothetical protein